MSASSEKVIEEKVTVKVLVLVAILTVALTIFWDVWTVLLPDRAFYTQNVVQLIPVVGLCFMGSPLVVLIIAMALIRIPSMRKYLTTTTLVYLYVTSLTAAYYSNTYYPWGFMTGLLFSRMIVNDYSKWLPEFMIPAEDVAKVLWRGIGDIGAIPWAALLPNVIWFFLVVALFGCINISLACIFRRQWIDVELMPFPQVIPAYSTLVSIESSVKEKWASKVPFLLGILFGILLEIPISAAALFPWFPDVYMIRTNTCLCGVTHQIASPDIPWHLGFTKNPLTYVLFLLVPLHFLFSLWFYTLVLEIAFFIAFYGFGYYTGMLQMGFCGRNWCTPVPYTDPPLNFFTIIFGCALGFFVITIFLERRYIIETLKIAFGRSRAIEVKEEPLSYRNAWIMFIVSFIATMVFFMYTGGSPWLSFAIVVTNLVMCFVTTHVLARAGTTWDGPRYDIGAGLLRLLVYPTLSYPSITSTELALGPVVIMMWQAGGGHTLGLGSLYTSMASFAMARDTKVSYKNVFKVMVVALFTSMFVTHLFSTSIIGVIGGYKFPGRAIRTPCITEAGVTWAKPTPMRMIDAIPWVAAGFIFMVAMRYLYSRILWLPDPLAAIPAWSWHPSLWGLWPVYLVAWVVKSIVLRLGGSRAYEEWVVPFVGGFMSGAALEILITATISFLVFSPTITL